MTERTVGGLAKHLFHLAKPAEFPLGIAAQLAVRADHRIDTAVSCRVRHQPDILEMMTARLAERLVDNKERRQSTLLVPSKMLTADISSGHIAPQLQQSRDSGQPNSGS
jgi:hypothetical protein